MRSIGGNFIARERRNNQDKKVVCLSFCHLKRQETVLLKSGAKKRIRYAK